MATVPAVDIQTLKGQLLQIRYRHPGSTWCVGVGLLAGAVGRVTMVGDLEIMPLREARYFYGVWVDHPKYGRQFQVKASRAVEPVTADGIARYLKTAHCPRLGEKTAVKLSQAFGSEALRVLREEPETVSARIKGVKPALAREWQTFFQAQRGADDVMVWLLQWDIDPGIAHRLYEKYNARAIAMVQANPYQLTENVWGIGFRTVDRMALSQGWAPLSPERLMAVWRFGLMTALNQGDCYQTTEQLIQRAIELLDDQNPEAVRKELVGLVPRLHQLADIQCDDEDRWQLTWVARTETRLARAMRDNGLANPMTESGGPVDWAWLQAKLSVTYAPAQQEAVAGALAAPFSVITGGPGTGKTTILRGLLTWLQDHDGVRPNAIVLAAPTGRAAQRMMDVTGHEALTLHRLLEWSPQEVGFTRDAANPLEADWVIVDEVSMMDLPLASAFWQAIKSGTRVVWIGDENQLPSVGPGSVLKDVIASGRVPVYRLTHNFRSTSGITGVAHTLLRDQVPSANEAVALTRYPKGVDKKAVQDALVAQMIAQHQAGTPWEAMQVLTPIRRGLLGTEALNARLRDVINPARDRMTWTGTGGATFRQGDRVMQTKNFYAKDIMNGDIGLVVGIHPDPADRDSDDDLLWVQFDSGVVHLTPDEAKHLQLAYAITVHKSQGSEFPMVFLPLCYDAYMMLYRNLVYTAVTRARDKLWIFTEASAIWLALKRGDGAARQTLLQEALSQRPTPSVP